LAVKGNQPTLHQGVQDYFQDHLLNNFAHVSVRRFETQESGHGRQEHRQYFLCPVPEDLPDRKRWEGLKAIGMVVQTVVRDGKTSSEVRYYILSTYLSGRRFAEAVRGHWGIENNLHWQLDVTFGEDRCRIRQGHADANFSALRRLALGLLKNEKTAKVGVKNRRLNAAWDEAYLQKVVFGPDL
jgi:predicted transposase YbfD/YdcC